MTRVSELSPREKADAVERMQENSLIVQWVQQCLEQRVSSYRWALERLVIQAPDGMAADADRLIGELAAQTANPPVAAQPAYGRAVSVRGRRGALWLAAALVLAALALALGLAKLRNGGDDNNRSSPPAPARVTPPTPAATAEQQARNLARWLRVHSR